MKRSYIEIKPRKRKVWQELRNFINKWIVK